MGLTDRQIAARLNIGDRTVQTHRAQRLHRVGDYWTDWPSANVIRLLTQREGAASRWRGPKRADSRHRATRCLSIRFLIRGTRPKLRARIIAFSRVTG